MANYNIKIDGLTIGTTNLSIKAKKAGSFENIVQRNIVVRKNAPDVEMELIRYANPDAWQSENLKSYQEFDFLFYIENPVFDNGLKDYNIAKNILSVKFDDPRLNWKLYQDRNNNWKGMNFWDSITSDEIGGTPTTKIINGINCKLIRLRISLSPPTEDIPLKQEINTNMYVTIADPADVKNPGTVIVPITYVGCGPLIEEPQSTAQGTLIADWVIKDGGFREAATPNDYFSTKDWRDQHKLKPVKVEITGKVNYTYKGYVWPDHDNITDNSNGVNFLILDTQRPITASSIYITIPYDWQNSNQGLAIVYNNFGSNYAVLRAKEGNAIIDKNFYLDMTDCAVKIYDLS